MASAIVRAVVTPVFHWPFRLLRAPVRFILVVTGFKNRKHYNIPVAGLEQSKAQSILFTLRRAASSEEAS